MKDESPIESLPNIGPKSSQWLRDVGITTVAELKCLGPVVGFQLVRQREPNVSINLLWALAAGLESKDWRDLTVEQKNRLRNELAKS